MLSCRGYALNLVAENVVGRFGHGSVVVSVETINACVGMSGEFHHAPHVEVFFVAAVQFVFGVAGDENEGRCVGTYVV